MPQMAPMWWTTLFMMFIMSYIMYMMTMYFFTMYNIKMNNINSKSKKYNMNWMW